ncbi:MAG: hypothetical protein IT456_02735, partial [Planctomycetes bacterium]|nr:hypothetical protein [Planctomycetota bacterium]
MRSILAASILLLSVMTPAQAAPSAAAQDKLPKWRIDPFTKNKPDAMTKAGYVSYGPFPFG